ncbi:MAG TPA: alginate export family protein [Candidatus Hydrogenedentes bacterium]|nr:alginate export family protein [Candidatus Hydrogenedentota bacterium]HPU96569.1 alginate export family protein [Candidatus Hydrogenedentota bacterium]
MNRRYILPLAAVLFLAGPLYAELQNVEVGGSLRIRGNYYNLDSLGDLSYIEQRTRLSVKADFTDEVTAFVELDSFDLWGEDFRSDYLRGIDGRANSSDDVEIYQAYIEARNMWGTPIQLRVGRQELAFGSQWLVGVNDAASFYQGLSFDAIRLSWVDEAFRVDGFAAKLGETVTSDFGSDDLDFYGVYASVTAIEDHTFDAYWFYVRDDNFLTAFDVDLHTVGIRAAGVFGAFDYEVEGAYQFGDVDGLPSACPAGFGEADVKYDSFGVFAQAGYTFDITWKPRLFARFSWLDGGDPDNSPWSNDRTLPFNRLFSNYEYTEFFANTDESNFFYYGLGLDLTPTEAVTLQLVGGYFVADERALVSSGLFGSRRADRNIGLELGLYGSYAYSEDLTFNAGYVHFFGNDGLADNRFIGNGLLAWNGSGDDDYDYLFIETQISF